MKKLMGFTLIELLIVVAMVAILSVIALPSYNEHVRKTRRAQAKTDMLEYSQMLERRFTLNRSYAGFPAATYSQSPRTGYSYYGLTFAIPANGTSFTITAAPAGSQVSDTKCGTLTLDSTATRGASGPDGVAGCW